MAEGCVGDPALNMGHDREGRVHQNDGRDRVRVEVVIDLCRIEPRDVDARKKRVKEAGTHLGEFVEHQRAARDFGEDGEQARAGGRFEHAIRRGDCGCRGRGKGKWHGGGELLESLHLFGAARMRRQKGCDLRQKGQACRRRSGFADQRLPVFAEHEHGGGLAGLVSRLPVPGAAGIGGAEGGFHGLAQYGGINALAFFEKGKEQPGDGEDGTDRVDVASERKRCGGGGHRGCGNHVHRGRSLESGKGRSRAVLSLDRTGSNPSRPSSPSHPAVRRR